MTIALRVGRRDHDTQDFPLSVDAGAYALSGTAAGLSYGREIASTNGSYTLTGTASTFLRSRRIVSTNGSYAITGTAATLDYSGGGDVNVDWNDNGSDSYNVGWDSVTHQSGDHNLVNLYPNVINTTGTSQGGGVLRYTITGWEGGTIYYNVASVDGGEVGPWGTESSQ